MRNSCARARYARPATSPRPSWRAISSSTCRRRLTSTCASAAKPTSSPIRASIERAINASPSLRNKKDLIEAFVDSVSPKARVDEQWLAFIAQRKIEELERIIAEENLHPEAARRFMDDAFRDGGIASTGTAITQVLPPTSRFGKTADSHTENKRRVLQRLAEYWERFAGLI
ncbi:MAG: hypothetical protein WA917_04450 [Comamonas sp.]